MELDPNRLDWNHLRAFLATARTQSLSGAARQLGLTQPTLSRQIAALEDHLSLLLFERVGRGLQITEAGREVLAHVRDMGLAAERATVTATGQAAELKGWVRITASDIMSAHIIPNVATQLRTVAPQLQIEVVATNDISDLLRREADIAIRHMRPEEPNLIARRVAEAEGYFYAAKSYLDRVGRPQTKEDMARMDWVAFGDVARMVSYLVDLGIPLKEANCRASSENGLIVWEMAKAGLGLCPMDSRFGDEAVGMERVMPKIDPIPYPVWLVAHRELHTNPKIRLVFDMLAQALVARSA